MSLIISTPVELVLPKPYHLPAALGSVVGCKRGTAGLELSIRLRYRQLSKGWFTASATSGEEDGCLGSDDLAARTAGLGKVAQ
jgi:hypothetical protein